MAKDSGSGDQTDKWRLQLEDAERELETKAKEMEKVGELVNSTISKLVRTVSEKSNAFEAEIKAINKALTRGFDIPAFEKAVARLSDQILHFEQAENISNEKPQQSASVNDGRICALLISEILYQLMESISLPAELHTSLEALKKSLENGIEVGQWGDMLEDVADLAADIRMKINTERTDTETFLKQVTGRLQELDSYIQGSESSRQAALLSGKTLDDAVKLEMRELHVKVAQAEEVDSLKFMIRTRLEAIESHFSGFRNAELERHEKESDLVKALTQRLSELEKETEVLRERVQKERMQALMDPLTGIANRLGYMEHMNQEYARWKRFKHPLSLVVWDVDHFKRINDSYGHAAGDKALKALAKLISSKVRETDFVARFGGEEFVVIMPGADLKSAESVADKLRASVEGLSFHFKGEPVSISVSCGVAQFKQGETIESVFERADKALYQAKEGGRNRVVTSL